MTIIITRNLNNTVTETALSLDTRSWSDWSKYTPIVKKEEVKMKVRSQKNGLRIVDELGRFCSATDNERSALIRIFEDAQEVPMKKEDGVWRSAMASMEECELYATMGRKLGESGRLITEFFGGDEPKEVYIKTDVPRTINQWGDLVCHSGPVDKISDWMQKRDTYQLREFAVGNSYCGSDHNDWWEDECLHAEAELVGLGFTSDMVSQAREIVQENIQYSQTHRTWTFEVWDVYMAPRREAAYRELMDSVVKPDPKALTDFMYEYCRNDVSVKKVERFIRRVYDHAIVNVKADGDWFTNMCKRADYAYNRINTELNPTFCDNKDMWSQYRSFISKSFWFHHKHISMWNKAQFENQPTKEERKAISYMMWLDRIRWESETNEECGHFDNQFTDMHRPITLFKNRNEEFDGEAAELYRLVEVQREITDLEHMKPGVRRHLLRKQGVKSY